MIYSLFLLLPHFLLYHFSIKQNSFYVMVFNSVFLVLVTGQAIFIEYQFQYFNQIEILKEFPVTNDGYYLALLLYSLILYSIAFFLMLFFYKKRRKNYLNIHLKHKVYINYWLLYFIVLSSIIYYLYIIGGVSALLNSTRPSMISGATFPLSILLSTSIIFIYKIYFKNRLLIKDYILIVIIVILLFLSGSRVLIVYYLSSILFAVSISYIIKIKFSFLIYFFIFVFLVLIVGQAVKQIQGGESSGNILEVILLVVKIFYLIATEGFAGFAGYMSYGLEYGFTSDFGISLLKGFLQFIPGQIRNLFGDFNAFLNSFYPYKYSIVTPGLQNFFIHFSFFSILVFPFIFIYLTILEYNFKNKYSNFFSFYIVIVLLTQSLTLIRGSTVFFIYYSGVHLIIGGALYLIIISKFIYKEIK